MENTNLIDKDSFFANKETFKAVSYDKIKTFYDAYKKVKSFADTGDKYAKTLINDISLLGQIRSRSTRAFIKLKVLTYALNDAWLPKNSNSYIVGPEIQEISTQQLNKTLKLSITKDKVNLHLWNLPSKDPDSTFMICGAAVGSIFEIRGYSMETTKGFPKSILFKDDLTAKYAGMHFLDLYLEFILGDTVKDILPWRFFMRKYTNEDIANEIIFCEENYKAISDLPIIKKIEKLDDSTYKKPHYRAYLNKELLPDYDDDIEYIENGDIIQILKNGKFHIN